MGSITQRFAKQSFGCIGIAQSRKQEINSGTVRIDGPIQVAPRPCTRTYVSSTRQDLLVGLRCRRMRCSSSGPYRCTAPHSRMIGLQPTLD